MHNEKYETETRIIEIEQSGNSFTIHSLSNSNQGRYLPAHIYISSMDLVFFIGGRSDVILDTVSVHHVSEDRWRMLTQTLN